MKKIEQHIFELLFQHDCVILPDFGGFVANYISAKIDDTNNRIYPPSKQVIFNKHLLNNDGLLAHKIIASDNINYEEALSGISDFVERIKASLSVSKRFEIDKVGILFLDERNNICFKPGSTNFLINSFGLPIVKAIPIIEEKLSIPEPVIKEAKIRPIEIIHEKDKLQPVKEDEKVIPITATNYPRRRNYWWAAAVLIPIAFYSAWIPMKTDLLHGGDNFQFSDLNPFTYSKAKVAAYHKHDLDTMFSMEREAFSEKAFKESLGEAVYGQYEIDDSNNYLTVQLKEIEDIFVAETTYVEVEENIAIEEVSLEKGYFVIGGCFGKKSNADKLVEELIDKGYSAMIVDENEGLHRVAFGKYNSRKEAKKAKKEIKKLEGLSAWVLKK